MKPEIYHNADHFQAIQKNEEANRNSLSSCNYSSISIAIGRVLLTRKRAALAATHHDGRGETAVLACLM